MEKNRESFYISVIFLVNISIVVNLTLRGRLKDCEIFSCVKFICEKSKSRVFTESASA